ncbi:hypothetical protein BMH32_04270 [Leucobacter sp. OLJS4]|uniref:hypothetical protein n=1 Tax=unclassified Leucobacter TaxID=2621730 RepID=UPI000C17BFCD|nr:MULTISPECIES: hypothetical protein [unclassified Leucobacter]PII82256.1 hypothetical protein BMH25_10170 [Leucobacter sp. OLCALW19]PII88542.1 hypothetical protein BMH26_05680 [Leucobacter sp. OLTLW20]PII94151.1 hypothetical protein BMH27_01790 [Leucobacter sp. OLAS13]PII98276.1 hypothetical protein BMH29_08910 [Leucobacter sp. OLDS2]PIJ03454.1 hypothetical protein BMH31_08345 [Leucobacter sp. OLIS6]
MSRHEDQALLEAVSTHRQRLRGAFVGGRAGIGRGAATLTGRLIGSLVIAAVACAVCVGVSFVLSVLPTLKQPKAVPAPVVPTAVHEKAQSQ